MDLQINKTKKGRVKSSLEATAQDHANVTSHD